MVRGRQNRSPEDRTLSRCTANSCDSSACPENVTFMMKLNLASYWISVHPSIEYSAKRGFYGIQVSHLSVAKR